MWELTKPVPLDDDGSSAEAVLGKNPDVHYIYICTKVCSNCLLSLHLHLHFLSYLGLNFEQLDNIWENYKKIIYVAVYIL